MKPVFVSVVSVPPTSLVPVVFVAPVFVSVLLLLFVMVCMVCVMVVSGRCSAAMAAPLRGLASRPRVSVP